MDSGEKTKKLYVRACARKRQTSNHLPSVQSHVFAWISAHDCMNAIM